MDPLRLRKDRELIIKILYEIDSTSHPLETIINIVETYQNPVGNLVTVLRELTNIYRYR